jgi:hypothetical protein
MDHDRGPSPRRNALRFVRAGGGIQHNEERELATVSREPKPLSDFPASRTALVTSLMRAVHSRFDPNPLIDDLWGERLVPESFRLGYRAAVLARMYPDASQRAPVSDEARAAADAVVISNLRASPAYAGVILRTRYTEDALRVAVAGGVRQYVIIGAGFDSFALRRPAFARELTIFEIDQPATQEFKRLRLAECGGPVAGDPALDFAAVDVSRGRPEFLLVARRHDVPDARSESRNVRGDRRYGGAGQRSRIHLFRPARGRHGCRPLR